MIIDELFSTGILLHKDAMTLYSPHSAYFKFSTWPFVG